MRLAELQQLEVRLIPTDEMGRMIPEELGKALDPQRPALIVYSMGAPPSRAGSTTRRL